MGRLPNIEKHQVALGAYHNSMFS